MIGVDVSSRFWSKVDVRGPDQCWLWRAYVGKSGYGRFGIGSTVAYAHRVAYEDLEGPIPTGLTLDHLCRNKACVNPAHLEPVTLAENFRRAGLHGMGAVHRAATHCANGHPFDGHDGRQRTCLTCKRQRGRDWMRKQRARAAA